MELITRWNKLGPRGKSLQIQFRPAATASRHAGSLSSTQQAREVAQQPTLCSAEEGHDPSGNWVPRRKRNPVSCCSFDGSRWIKERRAQHVASTLLGEPEWKPQPPSLFWAV